MDGMSTIQFATVELTYLCCGGEVCIACEWVIKCYIANFLDTLSYYQFHKADCAPWINCMYFCVHLIRGLGTLTFKPSWGNVPFIFSNWKRSYEGLTNPCLSKVPCHVSWIVYGTEFCGLSQVRWPWAEEQVRMLSVTSSESSDRNGPNVTEFASLCLDPHRNWNVAREALACVSIGFGFVWDLAMSTQNAYILGRLLVMWVPCPGDVRWLYGETAAASVLNK